MRLSWPVSFRKRESVVDPHRVVSTVGNTEERPGAEAARGAELLESNQVETEELGELAKLQPFRPVVISLLRLFDRPEVNIQEVCALVEADPAMASEMLAVVNSPLFAVRQTVSQPYHAIMLLGSDRTKSLAATLAMRSLSQGGPRTPIVRRFWIHSIATATIAKRLAPAFQLPPEVAHVSALLHDLGRNGLLAAYPERYAQLACTAHGTTAEILAAESAEFGMDHCQAGAKLCRAWSLPDPIRAVAGHHHDKNAGADLVALVRLSCRLADDFMYQAIHRADTAKPEETIEQYATEQLRTPLKEQLETMGAAIDSAIQLLDF